jgi:hypothetical protein
MNRATSPGILLLAIAAACGDDGRPAETAATAPSGTSLTLTDPTTEAPTEATDGTATDGTSEAAPTTTTGPACGPDSCPDGACIGDLCCPIELACGDVCCQGDEVCSFQQCVVPDVWSPYVQAGPINGFTSAALLDDGSIAAGGFYETQQGIEAVAVKIDGATGKLESGPIALGKTALAAAGSGPAIAAGDDGAVFVASTRAGPMWAVSKLRIGEPLPIVWTVTGDPKTKALAVTVAGPVVIIVGALEISPGTHDLRV